MTPTTLYLTIAIYLVALLAVVYFTRAGLRRVAGALAGGLATGVVTVAVDAYGETAGWWHFSISWEPAFLALLVVGWAVSVMPVFLVTWRLARRFGWRGPAVVALVATISGPPRDYTFLALHPEWGAYGPGIAPVLAIAVIYALLVPVGHGVMRLVAGPAAADQLARHPREASPRAAAGR